MRRSLLALALLALAALAAGCGGGDGTSTSATATAPARQGTTAPKRPSEARRPTPSNPAHPSRQSTAEGAPVPGSKAVAPGVPVSKGGDNSIQAFGVEGRESPRAQASAELRAYLGALLAGKWARACAATSPQFKRQLAQLIARARVKGGGEKPRGCAATLAALLGSAPPASLRAASRVGQVLSFRVRGRYAYLIFKGAGGKAMFIAMANDGGKWKVNVLKPEQFDTGSPR